MENRRDFLKESGLGVAALALAGTATAQQANEQLVVGVIGCGGMGNNHIRMLVNNKGVRVAYVCDPDENRLAAAAKIVEGAGKPPKAVQDLRQVLDDKSVDAVWIATPDHWHGPATILACAAGKHVYVEKPCSHNIREGRLMVEAARRHKKVVQTGTQSRSTKHVLEAMQRIRDGAIGDVLVAKAWNSQKRRNIGHAKPSESPPKFDYDLWVGPAPMVPFQANRHHYTWHWWYDFGTGDMGNDGVHQLDVARWGLGVDTHPSNIAALGGKYFFDDDQQFPDTMYVAFEYPGDGKVGQQRQLIFEQRIWSPYVQEGYENGNAFYGTKGYVLVGSNGGFQLFGEGNKLIEQTTGRADVAAHHRNFIDCIKSGTRPSADIEVGHLSATLCHLGNIATRTSHMLQFDPRSEQITNNSDANALVRRTYRAGHWATPQGV
ncbi:MAG: Gfo/Idh/MocA family protein [Gemmataceae bacterium]